MYKNCGIVIQKELALTGWFLFMFPLRGCDLWSASCRMVTAQMKGGVDMAKTKIEKYDAFCHIYVYGDATAGIGRHEAAAAYKAAGYHPKNNRNAIVLASRLLTQVDYIKNLIVKLEAEFTAAIDRQGIADETERRKILTKIARQSEEDRDRIKAVDTLNRMDGLYIQRQEITGPDGGALSVVWAKSDSEETAKR